LIICMTGNNGDFIWIGTRDGGVNKFDKKKKTFTHFVHDPGNKNSISENIISCITEDKDGDIWLGTLYSGVDRISGKDGKISHYRNDPADNYSLSGNSIWTVYVDGKNNVWMGTIGYGLNMYDRRSGKFIRYLNKTDDETSLDNDYVAAIYEYPEGYFWVGTKGENLNRLDIAAGKFERIPKGGGAVSILPDSKGRIWMFTQGLSFFDPQSKQFKYFDEEDGVNFGSPVQGAALSGLGGIMYFGGSEGFVRFHPDSVYGNAFIPPVELTDIKVFERSIHVPYDYSLGITLSYEENYFSFEFAALSFTAQEKNLYRYKLDGYDKDWTQPGTKRVASYTRVEPGNYTFRAAITTGSGIQKAHQ
jgi:streptogramin lyase